jgi:esterase/lipase
VGTSTGGTLALMLASRYPNIAGLVLLSPNIEIFSKSTRILNDPWGLNLARMINGSNYVYSEDTSALYKQYWSFGYRMEAAVQLEEMLETAMTPETFRKVKQPLLLLYYYKDAVHQDSVVSVRAMQNMYSELGTPPTLKREKALPNTGNHVIGSYIRSRDVEAVRNEIERFLVEVMKLK